MTKFAATFYESRTTSAVRLARGTKVFADGLLVDKSRGVRVVSDVTVEISSDLVAILYVKLFGFCVVYGVVYNFK